MTNNSMSIENITKNAPKDITFAKGISFTFDWYGDEITVLCDYSQKMVAHVYSITINGKTYTEDEQRKQFGKTWMQLAGGQHWFLRSEDGEKFTIKKGFKK